VGLEVLRERLVRTEIDVLDAVVGLEFL